ncbi:ParB/RepB/Spo0J family partition protein [Candidatus Kaiserbacteria bacterium]|nr:MAG: ParB/RepB/Spo0J family partition protein [Candidatus Kaiserbacteria bacterium]
MATVAKLESTEEDFSPNTIYPVTLNQILPFPDQPRQHFDEQGIKDLAESIQEKGQQTPVVLCKNPSYPEHFMLVGGERRFRAFTLISQLTGKNPEVLAVFKPFENGENHFRIALLDNHHRKGLCELDEAHAFAKLHHKFGDTIARIAKDMGKSVSHVNQYILVAGLPEEVKELMNPNLPRIERLNISAAIKIAQGVPKSNPDLRIELARESVERSLPVVEVSAFVERRTEQAGYRIGGSRRKPSDDYKALLGFFGRTKTQLKRHCAHPNIEALFLKRDDPAADKKAALESIDSVVRQLESLRRKIAGDET